MELVPEFPTESDYTRSASPMHHVEQIDMSLIEAANLGYLQWIAQNGEVFLRGEGPIKERIGENHIESHLFRSLNNHTNLREHTLTQEQIRTIDIFSGLSSDREAVENFLTERGTKDRLPSVRFKELVQIVMDLRGEYDLLENDPVSYMHGCYVIKVDQMMEILLRYAYHAYHNRGKRFVIGKDLSLTGSPEKSIVNSEVIILILFSILFHIPNFINAGIWLGFLLLIGLWIFLRLRKKLRLLEKGKSVPIGSFDLLLIASFGRERLYAEIVRNLYNHGEV